MPDVTLQAVARPIDAAVRVPGSKSLTNRALLLAAMADGVSTLGNILVADDTRLMIEALRGLGVRIGCDESACRATVSGCGGQWPNDEAELNAGGAGTVARFLTAACCVGVGAFRLDGSRRMRERPIAPLVASLADLGASIGYAGPPGRLPITIEAQGLRGGRSTLDAADSSQFVSALLMAAPLARLDVMLETAGPVVSRPFIQMTIRLMEKFGAVVVEDALRKFIVPGSQRYRHGEIEIEPDATAASYFFAAAAATGGRVTVAGLDRDSLQGDLGFVDVLAKMGCRVGLRSGETFVEGPPGGLLQGIDVDLSAMPDVVQTLAVLAVFADRPTRIRNVANLKLKETDRLAALAAELARLGAEVELFADGLIIHPPKTPRASAIDTYDDHRMAMSFALAGLRLDGVVIRDAECVAKTFPGFFERWRQLAGRG